MEKSRVEKQYGRCRGLVVCAWRRSAKAGSRERDEVRLVGCGKEGVGALILWEEQGVGARWACHEGRFLGKDLQTLRQVLGMEMSRGRYVDGGRGGGGVVC